MNSENAELMKLFDEAIAHWERMIVWAKKQPGDNCANPHDMFEEIKKDWFDEGCRICLAGVGFEGCCAGLWRRVSGASTWEEWVERASDVLTYIKEKRKDFIDERGKE